MDCRKVHQLYGAYLRNQVSDEQKDLITRHVHDCVDCYLLDQATRKKFLEQHLVKAE